MLGKTGLLLSLLLLSVALTPAKCNPMEKDAEDGPPALNRQKRTFGFNWFGPSSWPQFRKIWSLPTITMSHIFDEDQVLEDFHKRILNLENGQRRIINYIRKLKAESNGHANANGHGTTQLPERLPTRLSDSVESPAAAPGNVTKTFAEPEVPTTTSTTPHLDDSVAKLPQEQQPTTVATRLKDDDAETESMTTIGKVTTESSSSEKSGDKKDLSDVEINTTSEEPMKSFDEDETTVVNENGDSSEENNEVMV